MDDVETIEGVKAKRESAKALLVKLADGREVWVPKSVIHDDSEVWKENTSGKLVVHRWFAEKEGLE
jgi:hypothetical protein